MGRTFLYRCPATGQNVQGLVEGEATTDGSKQYEAMECAACRRFHFINLATLKPLAEEIDD